MSLALLVTTGAAILMYAPLVGGLIRQWATDETASYGILLACAATFLIVRRWRSVRAMPVQPSLAGAVITGAAMLAYLAGSLAGDLFVQRVSLPLAAIGAVLGLAGWVQLRRLAAPLMLFALAIPLPSVVVTTLTLPLQLVSSQIAADLLTASSIHVVREGNLLVLDRMTLEVAEACSGLQSLTSLTSVAAIAATVLPINRWGRVLMFVTVVPIAIIGNGLRIAATGVLTTLFGEVAVRGLMHEATGFAAFLVMCFSIFALLRLGRFSTPEVA